LVCYTRIAASLSKSAKIVGFSNIHSIAFYSNILIYNSTSVYSLIAQYPFKEKKNPNNLALIRKDRKKILAPGMRVSDSVRVPMTLVWYLQRMC